MDGSCSQSPEVKALVDALTIVKEYANEFNSKVSGRHYAYALANKALADYEFSLVRDSRVKRTDEASFLMSGYQKILELNPEMGGKSLCFDKAREIAEEMWGHSTEVVDK